jgi:DNA-binding NarL/FixJ family response regulator
MVSQPEELRKKVLLIDSDELVRSAMVSFLDARECELTACETVREGIEALDREDFDIILCDQSLPNEDCLEFFSLSRSSHPACKRVLLTSPKEAPHPADVLDVGVDAVIEKPLTAESVGDCLEQMIEAA